MTVDEIIDLFDESRKIMKNIESREFEFDDDDFAEVYELLSKFTEILGEMKVKIFN